MTTQKISSGMRYDRAALATDVNLSEEGYIVGKAIVTKCGVFLYKNSDGTIRRELRAKEDVTEPESMETIKLIPIVDGHPQEKLVNAQNVKRLAIGYTGQDVENIHPYIYANMKITDELAVQKIKSKMRNELSLGYTVDLVEESGNYEGEPYDFRQKNIRYNHLALVDEARAGREARIALDSNDAVEITLQEAKMAKKKIVKFDSKEYTLDEDLAQHIENLISEKERVERELEIALAERDAEKDRERDLDIEMENPTEDEIDENGKEKRNPSSFYESPITMKKHPVQTHISESEQPLPRVKKGDAAMIQSIVKARVQLEKKAEKYLDKATLERIDGISNLDIKKKIILALQKNAQLEGKSEIYINARYDSVIEDMPKEKAIVTPSRYDAKQSDMPDAKKSREAMIARYGKVTTKQIKV